MNMNRTLRLAEFCTSPWCPVSSRSRVLGSTSEIKSQLFAVR